MTKIVYDYNRAWTLLDGGDPRIVATMAADMAEAQGSSPVRRKDGAALRKHMTELAEYRDRVRAESCFVLSTTAPTVRAIAWTVTHSTPGASLAERFIGDSTAPRDEWIGNPEITEHDVPLGRATRIVSREQRGRGRRSSIMTVVRWVVPVAQPGHDIVVVLSSFVPNEEDVRLALPSIDALVQGMSVE